jgi:hypothetical protein
MISRILLVRAFFFVIGVGSLKDMKGRDPSLRDLQRQGGGGSFRKGGNGEKSEIGGGGGGNYSLSDQLVEKMIDTP